MSGSVSRAKQKDELEEFSLGPPEGDKDAVLAKYVKRDKAASTATGKENIAGQSSKSSDKKDKKDKKAKKSKVRAECHDNVSPANIIM
jgi:hypothetical protein